MVQLITLGAMASCGAVYCNRSRLWVCDSGRAVSEPYYSQHARSVCVSVSAFFIICFALNIFNHDTISTQLNACDEPFACAIRRVIQCWICNRERLQVRISAGATSHQGRLSLPSPGSVNEYQLRLRTTKRQNTQLT